MRRLFLALALVLLSTAARAEISGGVFAGYGLNDSNGTGSGSGLNAYGVTVGGRAGYTFGFGGYLGLAYAHHSGFSSTVTPQQLASAFSSTTATTNQPAREHLDPVQVELGYDLHLLGFGLRPYLGAGVVLYNAKIGSNGEFVFNSGKHPALSPGVLLSKDLLGPLFLGLDVRVDWVPLVGDVMGVNPLGGSASAVGASLMIGARI